MKIAIYPGSFDPITKGHVNIVERASQLFDKVITLVGVNVKKNNLFSEEERLEMARISTAHIPNAEVDAWQGLTVDYAVKHNAVAIIRGIRAVSDYEYEYQVAMTNSKMQPEINTVLLFPDEKYSYLTSSLIRELAQHGKEIEEFIPDCVAEKLREKF